MKTTLLTALLICSFGFAETQGTLRPEGAEGHGGDPCEQEWTALAYDLEAHLRSLPPEERFGLDPDLLHSAIRDTYLEAKPRVFVKTPAGTSEEKAAANYPKASPPRIEISETNWNESDKIQKLGLIAHEYAGILGLELDSYELTGRLRNSIEESQPSHSPQLLFEESFEHSKSGISHSDAARLCNQYKSMYEDSFFIVYCVFHQKNWTELKVGSRLVPHSQFLGYETKIIDSHSRSRSGVYAWIVTHAESDHKYHSFTQRPVYRRVLVPEKYFYDENHRIYGLRVFGVGSLSADLPVKTLVDSRKIVEGIVSVTFSTQRKAYIACMKSLLEVKEEDFFRFFRATCSVEEDTGKFYYLIQTKNPFVTGVNP